MIIYPLHNSNGEEIGKVGLEDESIPRLIIEGQEFKLEGAFYPKSKQFMNFVLVPVPSAESYVGR